MKQINTKNMNDVSSKNTWHNLSIKSVCKRVVNAGMRPLSITQIFIDQSTHIYSYLIISIVHIYIE